MGVVCALGLLLVVVVDLRFAQPIENGDLFWHMPVNWLLERGMEVDRQLINAGWTLPFGGSLLVAARRRDG